MNYQNRVYKFIVDFTPRFNATVADPSPPNLGLSYIDTVFFTGPDGVATTGFNPNGSSSSFAGFPEVPVVTFPSTCGGERKQIALDSEGLVLASDGSFW